MPSSLIVVALVVAWLVVLVPMIVRKRQEIARTADSALAARVVRSGSAEEDAMPEDADQPTPGEDSDTETDERVDTPVTVSDRDTVQREPAPDPAERRYRPGRGGFDPEAAALTARAKYAFRQRVVALMLLLAVGTAIFAGLAYPMLWWGHGAIDLGLVLYLGYLRRQVRIEEEIRQRRLARMASVRRSHSRPAPEVVDERPQPVVRPPAPVNPPNTVVVDLDDEDPAFDELEDPNSLPYRRAVGE